MVAFVEFPYAAKADDGRDLIKIAPALVHTKIKLRWPYKVARVLDFDEPSSAFDKLILDISVYVSVYSMLYSVYSILGQYHNNFF